MRPRRWMIRAAAWILESSAVKQAMCSGMQRTGDGIKRSCTGTVHDGDRVWVCSSNPARPYFLGFCSWRCWAFNLD
ncbi:hypothetical protein RchiOBHm_Chr3g0472181 [Rosa chinensis]|uniref:Secreted protein n=1 Tax=Rosa chinensis TaxID=74649 RepID=A0A2P6RBJ8_ROSCH|nr:hypothetical protein RchiOBHm_Chr3g0472181 [Rosa chinensis]